MCRQESRLSRRRQGGAIVILLGLAIVLLIGFAGLAIDLGRFFVIKTEIQNAVDACALSAASQLRPGQNNNQALIKAVAYGRVFATGGEGNFSDIKNRGNFQSTIIDITDITFSNTINGSYQPSGSVANDFNTARYVKCSYPMAGLPILFMQVLNPTQLSSTVSASAVATLGPSATACAIPVGLCAKVGGTSANNYGYVVGEWKRVVEDDPTQGWTGWITFPNGPNGASGLKTLLTGSGQCALTTTSGDVAKPGVNASVAEAWNSRFGLYKNITIPGSPTTAAPDYSGFAFSAEPGGNWLAGANAWAGSSPSNPGIPSFQSARSQHLPLQTPPMPPGIDINNYTSLTSAQHVTYGKNRRIAVVPVLNCADPKKVPIIDFACILMLNPIDLPIKVLSRDSPNIEFLGLSSAAGSACSTGGAPGVLGGSVPTLVQ